MILISVIVPTYRRPEYLKRCITALAKQTRKPDEVIVVVRRGDNESRQMVTELQTKFRGSLKVRMVKVNQPGVIPAENEGLAQAMGDIIYFTDDDAEPFPDCLARIVDLYDNSSIGAVGGRVINFKNGKVVNYGEIDEFHVGRVTWYGRVFGNMYKIPLFDHIIRVDLLMGGNVSFRKQSLDSNKIDENLNVGMAPEWELDQCLGAKRLGYTLLFDPGLCVSHSDALHLGGPSREDVRTNLYCNSHNQGYIMLKHLAWYGKIVFLGYFFLIGNRGSWGLLAMLIDTLIKKRITWRGQVVPSFKGKMDGIKTYLRWRRDRQERCRR